MHVLPKILIFPFVLPDLWARPDFRDSAAVDQTAEGLRKLNELQSRTNRCKSMFIAGDSESNSCGVVLDIQTPQEYAKFVFQAPRPYHLFVLFTMKGASISERPRKWCRWGPHSALQVSRCGIISLQTQKPSFKPQYFWMWGRRRLCENPFRLQLIKRLCSGIWREDVFQR